MIINSSIWESRPSTLQDFKAKAFQTHFGKEKEVSHLTPSTGYANLPKHS